MVDTPRMCYPALTVLTGILTFVTLFFGAPAAIVVAATYGLPLHAVASLVTLAFITGFGVTIGFHRLFTHRSFATFRGPFAVCRTIWFVPVGRLQNVCGPFVHLSWTLDTLQLGLRTKGSRRVKRDNVRYAGRPLRA